MIALLLVLLPLMALCFGFCVGSVVTPKLGARLIRDHAEGPARADVDEDQGEPDEAQPVLTAAQRAGANLRWYAHGDMYALDSPYVDCDGDVWIFSGMFHGADGTCVPMMSADGWGDHELTAVIDLYGPITKQTIAAVVERAAGA